MIHLQDIVRQHGGDPNSLLSFENDGPDLLPYATLTSARSNSESILTALVGVYEWQDRPLIMLVDGDALGEDLARLNTIRRLIAMRGDAPYLAVMRPGTITVHCVGLEGDATQSEVAIPPINFQVGTLIPYLGNERPQTSPNRQWISDVILRLLTAALDTLVKFLKISDGDAISLVGRALFIRFLADRGLLPPHVVAMANGGTSELFDSPGSAVSVCNWLDVTFNGDFLPLSATTINALPLEAFKITGDILRRAEDGQLYLEWVESWARLDFAHIPVGVLSQTYERYLSRHEKEKQREEGSYYTPRHIADLMVRASFSALRREGRAHSAKVLDPAAGAGVFLITAFRQLVAERWAFDGKRPDTAVLRDILFRQITGFDINDSALRFAALGLYLISIELDPNPEPVEKLRFDNLRPGVLSKFGTDAQSGGSKDLGSLGGEVGEEHKGRYDLVVGNPPWSKATKLNNWKSVEDLVLRIARQRLKDECAPAPLPSAVVDLPFVWRAMEWARPDGHISLALHARLLFQRRKGMAQARSALFGSIDVTGVINGTEVRQTKVWPGISAPFCLLFARNAVPAPGAGFRFLNPHPEGPLNQSGGWRLDAANAEMVLSEEVRERPELLKILFRGSRLDLELYDRVSTRDYPTFGSYWSETFGGTPTRPLQSGIGYKKLHAGSVKNDDGTIGSSAVALNSLPVINDLAFPGLLVDSTNYPRFGEINLPRLDRVRAEGLFLGPMLLVKESPPVNHSRLRSSVSVSNLVFNQSYHGYSAFDHADGLDLVKYLALAIGSKLTLWYALITSGRFGFEREVVEKFIVIDTPVRPFESLTEIEKKQSCVLFDRLAANDCESTWREVDRWIGTLFGLHEDDVQTIADTLEFHLPFAANRLAAQQPGNDALLKAFSDRLAADLTPWLDRFKRNLTVKVAPAVPFSPWRFVYIGRSDLDLGSALHGDWNAVVQLSDKLAATEIVYVDSANDRLVIGRLNQARYWSVSQARLVARRLIWEHVDFLSGKPAQ